MTEPIAYLNGQYLPVSQATLHVFDLGIVGGASVTEMVRTFRHVPFLLDEHLARLMTSLDAVAFAIEVDARQLKSVCLEVVSQNCRLIPEQNDLGLIVFITAGLNTTYIGRLRDPGSSGPTLCVHTFPLPFELWHRSYETGLHLATVPTQGIPDQAIDPRIKHRSRLHWHLAAREARQVDPDAMAILTDGNSILTETATGNLCVVDGSTIITPAAHVLKGISAEYVSKIAFSLGLSFVHAPVTVDDLSQADEAFLTSTPHCMLPVTRFNNRPIGAGSPGPVYCQLIAAWSDRVGVNIIDQMRQGAARQEQSSRS